MNNIRNHKCLLIGNVAQNPHLNQNISKTSHQNAISVKTKNEGIKNVKNKQHWIESLKKYGFQVNFIKIEDIKDFDDPDVQISQPMKVNAIIKLQQNAYVQKGNNQFVKSQQIAEYKCVQLIKTTQNKIKSFKQQYMCFLRKTEIVILCEDKQHQIQQQLQKPLIKQLFAVVNNQIKLNILDQPFQFRNSYQYFTLAIKIQLIKQSIKNYTFQKINFLSVVLYFSQKINLFIQTKIINMQQVPYMDETLHFQLNYIDFIALSCLAQITKTDIQEIYKTSNIQNSLKINEIKSQETLVQPSVKSNLMKKQQFPIKSHYYEQNKYLRKIVTKEQVYNFIRDNPTLKYVFTNGCFDIIHGGHMDVISGARSCGDILILGLNSDESVRKLKGPTRPINDQYKRAKVLAALQFVDFLIIFNEDTPLQLIKYLKPDTFSQGNRLFGQKIKYSRCSDAQIVNQVKILGVKKDLSTTSIIQKLSQQNIQKQIK